MASRREVVITGVGMVTPIGTGRDAFWQSLLQGQGGVRRLSVAHVAIPRVTIGAEVRDFDPKQYVTPRKSLKVMCREIQMAFAAAAMAIADSRLLDQSFNHDRFGVVLGSEMFYGELEELQDAYRSCLVNGEFDFDLWGQRALGQLYPLWMLKYLPNMAACHIGIAFDARAHNNTVVQGEASGTLALMESVTVIQRGMADVLIVGGTGSRVGIAPLLYRGDALLSHRSDTPQAAPRPFDAQRDGTVVGEGAGALLIESREHAEARGAPILARILGCCSTYAPSVKGASPPASAIARSIQLVLAQAELRPAELGHVQAHGAGTIVGDREEAQAIHQVLGDVPVTALKSYFGTMGAGGAAVELAGTVLSLLNDQIPATLNYQQPDPECPVNVISGQPARTGHPTAIALSQSTTGQAAAVLLAKTSA